MDAYRLWGAALVVVTALLGAGGAKAFDAVVEKKVFHIPVFTTQGGATIRDVRVGWECYGTLNAAKDNVILITHHFSGSSHAAGRYAPPDDATPGYWDYIIGPGRPLDTDKYFIISSDTLINLNAKDARVVTTGPASIDPDTGRPYGLRFPIVTIGDFVAVQKALLESLGITRLHAVTGASMGALQAVEWAVRHPEMVGRVIHSVGGAESSAWRIGLLDVWTAPIRMDPNWRGGDYYGESEPLEGLAQAVKIMTFLTRHWEWAENTFGLRWSKPDADPRLALDNRFAIQDWLETVARQRARTMDANHVLYLAKAIQLFTLDDPKTSYDDMTRIKSPFLIIAATDDMVFFPTETGLPFHQRLRDLGVPTRYVEIDRSAGHQDGIFHLDDVGEQIRAFLEAK